MQLDFVSNLAVRLQRQTPELTWLKAALAVAASASRGNQGQSGTNHNIAWRYHTNMYFL